MADADYFLDMSSSPDPLADEVPSSIRPASRRTTKTRQELSSLSMPQSSPRRGSRAMSPRKRTFQLDVGDERSPQRIRVTVEAEEVLKHDIVNRKLFPPPASPTKRTRRRETITTTTVPLNDEAEAGALDDEVVTPRKRGRQRRTSNGTPMPRSRKRAGTPIRRQSKQARLDDGPGSDTGMLEDVSMNMGGHGGGETARPKTNTRKTPRKPSVNASIPSSQNSIKTTGRKRGRPRKVPLSEEPTIYTGVGSEPGSESNIQHDPGISSNARRDGSLSGHVDDNTEPTSNAPPRQSTGSASPLQVVLPEDHASVDGPLDSPTSSHQGMAEHYGSMIDEDYQHMGQQSDPQSAESEDGMTHHRQDTIADASEFSMIAVESLPSFQASFQASFREGTGEPASDQHEMGEETSRIISQTLDSLRRSLQTEEDRSSHAPEARIGSGEAAGRSEGENETQNLSIVTKNDTSERPLAKSPRRPKQLPLSRQVFVGRGNIDDSFSSIPDSLLHAATPARFSTKATSNEHERHNREGGGYEDSFSEIPEAVLDAATPGPARPVATITRKSPARNEELRQTTHPIGRRSSLDYGSARLPTPEETSSSNAGSRNAQEGDLGPEPEEQPSPLHRTDVPSSPPIITRPRALDFGYSNLQHELNAVQERRSSSSQRQLSSKPSSKKLQSLEAPLPAARPSLSPIVRAGRTLQNVMSDNSSPETRERNLGSPFRGSMSSDYPRQSSAARSPSPSIRGQRLSNKLQLAAGSPTRLDRNSNSNLDRNLGRATRISDEIGDPSSQKSVINFRTESPLGLSAHKPSNLTTLAHNPPIAGPHDTDPLSTAARADRTTHSNSPRREGEQPRSFSPATSHHQAVVRTGRESTNPQVATDNMESQPEQDQRPLDASAQRVNNDMSNKSEEERIHDDNYDDDVDIWDIEASRASPGGLEPAQTATRPSKTDVPPPRRSRVPSPWRRNNRRLIYKDDFASSSQIEIEESSQSEVEQSPPIQSNQPPVSPPQPQQDTQGQVPGPEPAQEDPARGDIYGQARTDSPSPGYDNFAEDPGSAGSEEPDAPAEDDRHGNSESPQWAPDPMHEDDDGHEDHEDHEDQEMQDVHGVQDEPEDLDIPTAPEPSIHVSEYSMIDQPAKETPKTQEKSAPSKPRFFGGFNLSSFFSSPAALPTNGSSVPNPPRPANDAEASQATREARQPKEPPRTLWSAGLFPPVPQEEPSSTSGQRNHVFSPGPALFSTDTVADTYEPSTSVSSSPRSSEHNAPSTPERRVFPPNQQEPDSVSPVEQSRNPLISSREGASATRGNFDNGIEEYSDDQASDLTDGTDYERVPPRDKPSQWDRNLSPTKSCFRSPLKPTTPGRVVAFSNPELSPSTQAQARAQGVLRNNTNMNNTIPQGPSLRPTLEGKENQQHPRTQQSRNANNNHLDRAIPEHPTATKIRQQPRAAATAGARIRLSQTTWSTQHWFHIDEMLRLRRLDPIRFQQTCALPPSGARSSSALLGGEVSAHGARLVLEAWHLDVIDAFKLEVGGWDERDLAKRVFAVVIGWQKRRADAATSR